MINRSANEELSSYRHNNNSGINTADMTMYSNQSGLLSSHESTIKWKLRQEARNRLLQAESQKIPSDEDIDAFCDLLKMHCPRTSTDDVELIRYDEYRKAVAEVRSELLKSFIPSNLFMSLLKAYNDDPFGRIPLQVVIDYLRLRKDKINKIIALNFYDSNGKGYLTDEDLNDYISEEYMSRSPVITLLERDGGQRARDYYLIMAMRKILFFLDLQHHKRIRVADLVASGFLEQMEAALWDETCLVGDESKRQREDISGDIGNDKSDGKGNDKSDDKDSDSDGTKLMASLGSAVSEQAVSNWFSKRNFHRVAELYVQLDRDGNGLLDPNELADFKRITNAFINRIYQVTQTYEKDPPKIDLRVFIDFLLGIENRWDPASIIYHFRVLDLNGDGYLDAFELKYFYDDLAVLSEQCYGIDGEMQFVLPLFEDIKDEIFDMAKPKDPLRISLEELLTCGQGGTICGILTDLDCLLEYENREDPGRIQEES